MNVNKLILLHRILSAQIDKYNYYYFTLNKPIISDYTYDFKFKELLSFERHFSLSLPLKNSPTQKVGGKRVSSLKGIQHKTPMLSLNNAFDFIDIESFYDRLVKLTNHSNLFLRCEPKMDGLAISMHYKSGLFFYAVTRGDGISGEQVTSNVSSIPNVPLRLNDDYPNYLEVRGEIVISKRNFFDVNNVLKSKGLETFKTARNLVAGIIRQLRTDVSIIKYLRIYVYDIGYTSSDFIQRDSLGSAIRHLQKLGFNTSKLSYVVDSLPELHNYYEQMKIIRSDFSYDVDGVVYKLNNLSLQSKVGNTSRFPRWAVAYKFPAQLAESEILKVDFQIGRLGILTPVARIKPIFIGGVIISNVTLHNMKIIRDKDIRLGDRIIIKRAGDVIPNICKIIKDCRNQSSQLIPIPNNCPSCHSVLTFSETSLIVSCVNGWFCKSQRKEIIKHFVSREAMNIIGFGPSIINQLVDNGRVNILSDLYTLTVEDLLTLKCSGNKLSYRLINTIQESRSMPLEKFLFCMSIKGIGEKKSADISSYFESLEKLTSASMHDFLSINSLGKKLSLRIRKFLDNKFNKHLITSLLEAGLTIENCSKSKRGKTGNIFSKKNIAITGVFSNFARPILKDKLLNMGARMSVGLSKNVDFLLVGKKPGNSKMMKAKKLNIAFINELNLLQILSEF